MAEQLLLPVGHVVECRLEGGRERIVPVGAGVRKDWHCSFPRHLRQPGRRYLVERLTATARGYYASGGRIWRLDDTGQKAEELCRRKEPADGPDADSAF